MRHYEIIFLVNPNQEEDLNKIIKYYCNLVKEKNGKIHRLENWGRRKLAYPINHLNNAYYILMNIEITQKQMRDIKSNFRFNNSVIRNIIIRVKYPITEISSFLKREEITTVSLNKKN